VSLGAFEWTDGYHNEGDSKKYNAGLTGPRRRCDDDSGGPRSSPSDRRQSKKRIVLDLLLLSQTLRHTTHNQPSPQLYTFQLTALAFLRVPANRYCCYWPLFPQRHQRSPATESCHRSTDQVVQTSRNAIRLLFFFVVLPHSTCRASEIWRARGREAASTLPGCRGRARRAPPSLSGWASTHSSVQ
jgi:hypothetical protein